MKKKICFITNYASHYHLAKWKLLAKTFDIDFVFDNDLSNTNGIIQMDLKEISATTINVHNIFISGHLVWQSGIIKLTFKKKYNIFIVSDERTCLSSWIIAIIIKLNKNKKLFWGDGHGWYGRESFVKKILKRISFLLSDGEFVYGNYAKQVMIANGLNENKIWVVHNSLNYEEQLKYRNNFSNIYKDHFQNTTPVLIFIGRLTKEKKLDMILQSINNAKLKGEIFNCAIIGDGETKMDLIQKSRDLNIEDQVWFYGPCYSEEKISELLTNADLCVSPGNVGLTAMHSMVYGTPLITHNNFTNQGPEFESIIRGKTGDFFDEGNIDSLTDKIILWFKINKDRESIRKNCYQEIDNFWTPEFKINIFKKVIFDSNNL